MSEPAPQPGEPQPATAIVGGGAPAGEPAAQPGPSLLELAGRALDDPLFPERGARCLRCGERLAKEPAGEATECPRCKVALRSAEAAAGVTPARVWWQELLLGASFVPRGALRLLVTPGLWKFAMVPLLINICAIVLALWLAYLLNSWLGEMTGPDAMKEWTGWFWGALSWVVYLLGLIARTAGFVLMPVLAACLIVAFPFNLLYKLVFMPFMELLTEATERKVLAISQDAPFEFSRFYANLIVAIVDACLLTALQGLLYFLLLPLAFLGITTPLWLVGPPAIFAGMDYSDINLVRRQYVLREKVRLWRLHKWRFFGYGLSFFFLLAVPIVNAFVIPSAAAGGALLYLGLARK